MRKLILATLLATSSMTVAVRPAFAASQEAETSEADAKTMKELKEIEKLFANIFGAKNAEPIDPQRLILAEQTTAQIMPDGIYSKMMTGLMDKIMGAMFTQPGGLSDIEITLATGVELPEAGLDETKRKAVTALLDPNHAQRSAAMQNMLNPMMDKMARVIEPPMREGLARAYARKFSTAQLSELNSFLTTPTGSFYASESFLLQADPEVMQAMFSAMPALMGEFANPEAEIEKVMAAIPPAKTLGDLSTDEKDSLAKLLGTTADKLNEFGAVETSTEAYDATAGAAADAMAEGSEDPFANDAGNEPWWDRSNWDKADQKKIADLESRSSAMAAKSEEASTTYLNFETEVMLRLRDRYLAKGWKPLESAE